MLAGPSEVMIIANNNFPKIDLLQLHNTLGLANKTIAKNTMMAISTQAFI